jgi:hypothetical protein
MGLFGFGKKKGLDQPTAPPLDLQALNTDLPSMDGSAFGGNRFDDADVQKFDSLQPLPSLDAPIKSDAQVKSDSLKSNAQKSAESNSISFNVPTLDFTLPPADDEQEVASKASSVPSGTNTNAADGYDDINKLFIDDKDWKEPDWSTFEPYPEEKIDKPKSEDFKGDDLPHFKDVSGKSTSNFADNAVSEPAEPFRKPSTDNPLDIFVRGNLYGNVFTELDLMNKSLIKVDSQMNTYEEMLKKEEPLLMTAKDQMEYLYRKLNQIDKKVFVE